MECPRCKHQMDWINEDSCTGVVAADGGKETRNWKGYWCPNCQLAIDEEDLQDEGR